MPAGSRVSASRSAVSLIALLGVVVLAGCSAATTTPSPATVASQPAAAGSSAPVATPMPTPTPPPPSSPPATSEPTGVATSLDPCQLVTSQEASQLAGATFGAGQESTTSGNGKICTYGSQTLNVFNVVVGQAPDVATAQAEKAQAQAEFQAQAQKVAAAGLKVTELPSFADGAVVMSGSFTIEGKTISASSIYALKGAVFFGFSDLVFGRSAPSSAALQAQAQTVLGRLP